ncbi:hypothetical protein BDY24DRAFT_398709 [Mrakia frigida]|uniref:Cox19p n=1 Tax=Mrakia frigida TaxID=29902 RepID=UPI003FCC02BA
MSFGRPGNFSDSFSVSPPEKGSFPLDHDHDCSPVMKSYLSCLRKNAAKSEKCRDISKAYLQCRFDHGLMEKADWASLGFDDTPVPGSESTTASTSTVPPPPSTPSTTVSTSTLAATIPPVDAGKGSPVRGGQ